MSDADSMHFVMLARRTLGLHVFGHWRRAAYECLSRINRAGYMAFDASRGEIEALKADIRAGIDLTHWVPSGGLIKARPKPLLLESNVGAGALEIEQSGVDTSAPLAGVMAATTLSRAASAAMREHGGVLGTTTILEMVHHRFPNTDLAQLGYVIGALLRSGEVIRHSRRPVNSYGYNRDFVPRVKRPAKSAPSTKNWNSFVVPTIKARMDAGEACRVEDLRKALVLQKLNFTGSALSSYLGVLVKKGVLLRTAVYCGEYFVRAAPPASSGVSSSGFLSSGAVSALRADLGKASKGVSLPAAVMTILLDAARAGVPHMGVSEIFDALVGQGFVSPDAPSVRVQLSARLTEMKKHGVVCHRGAPHHDWRWVADTDTREVAA